MQSSKITFHEVFLRPAGNCNCANPYIAAAEFDHIWFLSLFTFLEIYDGLSLVPPGVSRDQWDYKV